ncbi:ATP synthase F0 subunit B [Flavobacterium sp. SE-s28]|uniref:ATP synthase F0 subunit B n=1 Tax=Flavobacterium silvaticum TaxID=1852020 RepID=A0A972JH95_9FLAO|nr:ATP synthase F0 subunit B [Flavobacterium silvaticum]
MNGLFKTLIAGFTAKKLGGGCIGTIIVFIIVYWLLGKF